MPDPTETAAARRGEYVTLRPLAPQDAAMTLRWRMGERASLLNRGAETVDEQERWIRSRPSSERNYVIELADGRAVGMVALVGIDRTNSHAESARFLIGEPDLVKGVPAAVESMKLLYEVAFDELGLERVWGLVVDENRRMLKWQLYLGMRQEGRLRNHYFIGGRFQDAICLGILAEEFRGVALPRMQALLAAGRKEAA